jgi:hypothetical protein
MSKIYVDAATYAVTGAQHVVPDSDGHLHIAARSEETPSAPWTTFTGGGPGIWVVSSRNHRTLAAAKAHLLTVGGWKR